MFSIRCGRVILVWLFVLFSVVGPFALCQLPAQANSTFTPEMQTSIAQAKAFAAAQFSTESTIGRKQGSDGFAATMDALGGLMTPDMARQCSLREGNDPDAKLALIAWDRRQHPEIYQELEDRYLHHVSGSPLSHVRNSPHVLPEHATEKYRLAWEYLMIAPSTGSAPQSNIRIARAIEKINDEASFTTYRLAFAISSDPNLTDPEYSQSQQEDWLDSLGSFQNIAGLRAILDCLDMAQNQRALQKQAAHQEDLWNLPQFVREEVIARMYHPAENARWKALIAALPQASLAPQQAAFLHTVLARDCREPRFAAGYGCC